MIIGITGSFGSGKTYVAQMFRAKIRNSLILDADKIAKDVMKRNDIEKKILGVFGTVDKKKLADIVFDDRNKLAQLNKIIHPVVIVAVRKEIRKNKNKTIILDVPLLIESGMHRLCDMVILVHCPRQIQIKRLVRKGFRRAEALRRMKTQMPFAKKRRYATYIIDNNGSQAETESQVIRLIAKVFI